LPRNDLIPTCVPTESGNSTEYSGIPEKEAGLEPENNQNAQPRRQGWSTSTQQRRQQHPKQQWWLPATAKVLAGINNNQLKAAAEKMAAVAGMAVLAEWQWHQQSTKSYGDSTP
jgi:hypothetical protein